tara:strand:+ start:273 stop:464 length:192 start_codon:yes stop_codon:yes gene_type:complete
MPRKRKRAAKKRPVPTNPALYARVKAEAKRKFKVYPSAYANGWLVRTYKKRGGRYRMGAKRRK